MTVMRESQAYKKLRKGIYVPFDHIERIENQLGKGMPDVHCCLSGVSMFIEIKAPIQPVNTKSILLKHKFAVDQKNWFLEHYNAGGRAFGLICSDKEWFLLDCKQIKDIEDDATVEWYRSHAIWHILLPLTKIKFSKLRDCLRLHNYEKS